MATTDIVLTVNNTYPAHNGAPSWSGTGGTWPAATYSFMLVAGYNGTSYADLDALGWPLAAVTAWNGCVVGAGDTAKQLTFNWTPPADLPDYYFLLVQVAATYDVTTAGRIAATVAGTAITTVVTAYPGSTPTLTLDDAYTTITLVPVNATPVARDSVRVGHDNSLGRQSYGTNTLYERIGLTFFANTCTAAQYKALQRWARLNIHVKLDDSDTTTYVDYWVGMLQQPTTLNSDSKNAGYPSMTFVVESEAYN